MRTNEPLGMEGQLEAIDRDLEVTQGESELSCVATVSRTYATDVEDLWDACTNPERLPRWFAPVTGDFQLGGTYQIQGNANGTIERCEAPRLFELSWEFGGAVSQVVVTITPEGADRARLHMEHRAEVPSDLWAQFGPGAVGIGWDMSALGLAIYVEQGVSIPTEQPDWMTSPDGIQFITGSSRRWANQSIEAGTPEAEARAAEARTTAAYTGAE